MHISPDPHSSTTDFVTELYAIRKSLAECVVTDIKLSCALEIRVESDSEVVSRNVVERAQISSTARSKNAHVT